jgi:hypothetical protein
MPVDRNYPSNFLPGNGGSNQPFLPNGIPPMWGRGWR